MEAVGPIILAVILVSIAGLFIAAAFLLWAARIAGIEKRSFGRALAVVILGGIASAIFSAVLSVVPGFGTALGFVVGFLVGGNHGSSLIFH